MDLVAEASSFPGSCHLSKSGTGPFVDTGCYTVLDERIYIQELIAVEIGRACGMATAEEHRVAKARVAELELQQVDYERTLDKLRRLQNSVRETFAQGAVRNDDDSFRIRGRRGEVVQDLLEDGSAR